MREGKREGTVNKKIAEVEVEVEVEVEIANWCCWCC